MEPLISDNDGVWLRALFICHSKLQATPRCVALHCTKEDNNGFISDPSACLAICKKACLVPACTSGANGSETGPSDITRCTHGTTIVVEYRHATAEDLEDSVSLLETSTSNPTPQEDWLLFACDEFLENFGFYHKEVVWVSSVKPLPLERVVLSPSEPSYSDNDIEQFINQLYDLCQFNTVVVSTGYKVLHQLEQSEEVPEPLQLPPLEDDSLTPWATNDDEDGTTSPPLSFDVLETFPVVQGKVTPDTVIVIIPLSYPSRSSGATTEYGGSEDDSPAADDTFSYSTTPSTHLPSFRMRTTSASDINFEDSGQVDMSPFVNDQVMSLPASVRSVSIPDSSQLVIEARLGEDFTLLHHYVILPKAIARKHNIWELQNILISASSAETINTADPASKTILTLNNNLKHEKETLEAPSGCGQTVRKRLAIARVYESGEQLQALIPRLCLNQRYTYNDLTKAYLHPELMFNLFPETLSTQPRRFFVAIENPMATPSPSPSEFTKDNPPALAGSGGSRYIAPNKGKKTDIKKMLLGSVATPNSSFSEELVKEMIKKHLIDPSNRIVINKHDAFSLNTEHGRLILRVILTVPQYDHGGISGDEFVYVGQFASFLPHVYYPLCPASYWDVPLPPGLEGYSNTLFQYLLPNLMHKSAGSSLSCSVVMMYGPPGVGKSTVIRSVARRCRLNVKEFNCYDFFSEGLKAAEQKLRIAFDKAIDLIPCIMVLKEIHVLTKQDLSVSNGSHEPRLDTAFEQNISSINKQLVSANYPVIIVGVSTQPKEVSPRIQHCFLHEMSINPPTQEQRLKILQGLSLEYSMSRDVDMVDLARRSAGFVLGDFVEMFSKAHSTAYSRVIQLMRKSLYEEEGWIRTHHMRIFGTVIDQSHMDSALSMLHSSHSGYIGAPKIPNVKWSDVGGLEEAKKEILETIQLPLLHPELFVGGLRRSGILLYGAPGTGKTLLAKAVATECSLNFLSVKGPELINMYVGQTEENIREIFTRARGAAPCVVFFDELDSLAPNRGKSGDSGGVMDRVVSQLLAELDGLDQKKDLFVIGATNRPDLIDPALLRPGRFDRLVYLDVCDDVQSKLTILKAITRKFNLQKGVDLAAVAEACPAHLTGADLYALCADAMLSSLRQHVHQLEDNGLSDVDWNGSLAVDQKDFIQSLESLTPSVSASELDMYRRKQFLQNIK